MYCVLCVFDVNHKHRLQERGGSSFTHEALTLKYKLDNEFELVFVVSSLIFHELFKITDCLVFVIFNLSFSFQTSITRILVLSIFVCVFRLPIKRYCSCPMWINF